MSSDSDLSESDSDQDVVVEGCGSPRMQRKRRMKKLRERMERRDSTASQRPLDDLLYDDNLPEVGGRQHTVLLEIFACYLTTLYSLVYCYK